MKKQNKPRPRKSNVTHEKLADLPFKSAKALKTAQEQVRLDIWRRMEEAKVIHEMIQRKEYQFWHEEFKQGLVCAYAEEADHNLVRVFSTGEGIKININPTIAESAPSREAVLETLVRAMSESFAMSYYRAKGILSSPFELNDPKSKKS